MGCVNPRLFLKYSMAQLSLAGEPMFLYNSAYGPFLLKLLVTVKIMYKKKFFKCAINVVKAVQVNIHSNAYMKLQSMN